VCGQDHFDFIHSRDITYTLKDLAHYVGQMYKHVKPGGWVELVEAELGGPWSDDDSVPADCAFVEYMQHFVRLAKVAGFGETNGHALKQRLEAAGFVDVHAGVYKLPWGTWPKKKAIKEQGAIGKLILESGFEVRAPPPSPPPAVLGLLTAIAQAYGVALFTRVGGMSIAEVNDIIDRAKKDVANRAIHSYSYRWHVIGRRPTAEELAAKD